MQVESKSWRPGHWGPTKRLKFEDDVWWWMEVNLEWFLGQYEGDRRAAELRGHRDTLRSIEALRDAGVRTLGEV